MTIRDMRVFMAVCENGNNLSRAAKVLYMTQPSVTLSIQEIEKEYGVLLFDRISRRLYLTQAGEEFRRYAQRILSLYDEMDGRLCRWNTSGMIHIGASMTIGSELMPQYVEKFEKIHPEAQVRVLVEHSVDLEEKLLTNELDLALLETPVHHALLRTKKFMTDSLVVVAPPDVEPASLEITSSVMPDDMASANPLWPESDKAPERSMQMGSAEMKDDSLQTGTIEMQRKCLPQGYDEIPEPSLPVRSDTMHNNGEKVIRRMDKEQKVIHISARQFASTRLLLREKGSGIREVFEKEMEAHGLYPEPVWEAGSTVALIHAVQRGMGLSVLPRRIAEPEIQKGRMVRVEIEGLSFQQDFFIVTHRDKVITPMLQDFEKIVG